MLRCWLLGGALLTAGCLFYRCWVLILLALHASCRSGEAFLKPTADAAAIAALAAAPAAYRAPAAGGGGGGGFKPPAGGGAGGFKRPGAPGGGAAAAAAAAAEPPKAFVLHDPHAEGAVLLNSGQWAGGRGMLARDKPVSPVVVDPYLARHLRPHQVGAAPKLQHRHP